MPPGVAGLKAEDLALVYVEGDDAGVRFRPLAVDQEGEFIDRWPHGFILLRHKTSPPDSGCPQSATAEDRREQAIRSFHRKQDG